MSVPSAGGVQVQSTPSGSATGGADAPRLIAVTGYGQESERRRAFEAGFDEHLIKPAEPARLNDLIARWRERLLRPILVVAAVLATLNVSVTARSNV